jgi:hypothetical protein
VAGLEVMKIILDKLNFLRNDAKGLAPPRVKRLQSLVKFGGYVIMIMLPSLFNYLYVLTFSGPDLFKFFLVMQGL